MSKALDVLIAAVQECTDVLDDPKLIEGLRQGQDIRMEDIALDSLARYEVMMRVEDSLGIEIDDNEIVEHEGLLAIAATIEAKVA